MFELVTDIAVLVKRETDGDMASAKAMINLKASHPDLNVNDLIPSVLDQFSNGNFCDVDGGPTVGVESKSTGEIVRMCREVLSAVKMASLAHTHPDRVCYRCKIKRNPNGVVSGALHASMSIDDMTRRIADGKVSLDPDTNEVRIDD